jgi:hypothetical protein
MANYFTAGIKEKSKLIVGKPPEEMDAIYNSLVAWPNSLRHANYAVNFIQEILNKELKPIPFVTSFAIVSWNPSGLVEGQFYHVGYAKGPKMKCEGSYSREHAYSLIIWKDNKEKEICITLEDMLLFGEFGLKLSIKKPIFIEFSEDRKLVQEYDLQ